MILKLTTTLCAQKRVKREDPRVVKTRETHETKGLNAGGQIRH
jgi:hypothetical protein